MAEEPVLTHRSTEDVSIGEGFAFFRFHVFTYPYSECWGFRDKRPGMGYCMDDWRKLKHDH